MGSDFEVSTRSDARVKTANLVNGRRVAAISLSKLPGRRGARDFVSLYANLARSPSGHGKVRARRLTETGH